MTRRYRMIRNTLLDLHNNYPFKSSICHTPPELFRLRTWLLLALLGSSLAFTLLMLGMGALDPDGFGPPLVWVPLASFLTAGLLLTALPFEHLVIPSAQHRLRPEHETAYQSLLGSMILALAQHGALSPTAVAELQIEAEQVRRDREQTLRPWTSGGKRSEMVFWVSAVILLALLQLSAAGTQTLAYAFLALCSIRLAVYILSPFLAYAKLVRVQREGADEDALLLQYLQEILYCLYETNLAHLREKRAHK